MRLLKSHDSFELTRKSRTLMVLTSGSGKIPSPRHISPYLIDGSRLNPLIIGSALGVVGTPPYTAPP